MPAWTALRLDERREHCWICTKVAEVRAHDMFEKGTCGSGDQFVTVLGDDLRVGQVPRPEGFRDHEDPRARVPEVAGLPSTRSA